MQKRELSESVSGTTKRDEYQLPREPVIDTHNKPVGPPLRMALYQEVGPRTCQKEEGENMYISIATGTYRLSESSRLGPDHLA